MTVIVDPDVKALVVKRPILGALDEYGVLVTREQTAGSLTEADVLSVLATSLPPAPNGFSYRTPAAASSDGLRERLSDVCIELAILGHQIQDALDCPVTSWRTLEAIVQTVERCRSTYSQGVGSQHAGLRRTIAKMYSREDVQSISWRSAGDELLAALAVFSAQLDRQLEQPGPLAATSFEPGATDPFFDMFFDRLRDVGVGITASDFVP